MKIEKKSLVAIYENTHDFVIRAMFHVGRVNGFPHMNNTWFCLYQKDGSREYYNDFESNPLKVI